jgi:outer membrane protein assembly factor BamB
MNGRVYAATGNGDFDANKGGHNYGDSVLALNMDLSDLLGSYTPADYNELEENDTDLGSTSPAILPPQTSGQTPLMLVQGGKDGILRLLNRAALPGVGNELQEIDLPNGLFSTPAVWTDASDRTWIYLGFDYVIEAFRLETNSSGISQLVGIWQSSVGSTGAQGSSVVVANGIAFIAFDGQIIAFNALNGNELWSSASPSAGKTIGHVHWQSPIVVNGSVYCSDESGNLTAYALR